MMTLDAVHDQARPDLVLAGIARSLRPGGTYLRIHVGFSSNLEDNLDHPGRIFVSTWSTMKASRPCWRLRVWGSGQCGARK